MNLMLLFFFLGGGSRGVVFIVFLVLNVHIKGYLLLLINNKHYYLFHQNFNYTENLSCPSRIICYLFIRLNVFLRIMILSFQSHQTRILIAGLGMAWNRYGLSCIYSYLAR